jgi:hypothetical protein
MNDRGIVLDEALGATRLAWRSLAIPLLASLPWWLLVAEGLRLVAGPGHGHAPVLAFLRWSSMTVCALILAAWGRAAWSRQVVLALDGQVAPAARLRLPLTDVVVAVWLHGVVLLVAALGSWLILPALLLPWGLALAAAGAATRPGMTAWSALTALVGDAVPMRPWLGACLGCGCAALLLGGNLWLGGYGLASLLADLVGVPAHLWTERLAPWNPNTWIAFLVLGMALTDPLVVAAAVVHQRRCQARTSGSDLAATLTRLEAQP